MIKRKPLVRSAIAKPNFADRINWENPICKDMILALPLNSHGQYQKEYVSGALSDTAQTNTNSPQVVGNKMSFPGADGNNEIRFTFANMPLFPTIGTGPFTLLIRAKNGYTGRHETMMAFDTYNPSFFFKDVTGNISGWDSTLGDYISDVALDSNYEWHNIGYIRVSTSTNDWYVQLNNVRTVAGTYTRNISSVPTYLRIGTAQANDASYPLLGTIDYIYMWNRALSVDECNSVFVNQSQLFTFASTKKYTFPFKEPPSGGVSITLAQSTITIDPQAVTMNVGGGAFVTLSQQTITEDPQTLTVTAGGTAAVSLTQQTITLNPQTVTVTAGAAINIQLDIAIITVDPIPVSFGEATIYYILAKKKQIKIVRRKRVLE